MAVGVWVGNADNAPMVNVSGVSGAGPLWHDFMRWVLKGQPERAFARPERLTRVEVCALSGGLPSEACAYRRMEWFIAGTEPTTPDTLHHRVTLDAATPLYEIYGSAELEVCSWHHQEVRRLGTALRPVAHAADGVVEAIVHSEHFFALGVQWHPETFWDHPESFQSLFDAQAEACRNGAGSGEPAVNLR